MAYRCTNCGNTRRFREIYDATITEYVDGSGEPEEDNAGDVNKIDDSPQLECDLCDDGGDVEQGVDPIGELPRDHPARLDMGGTGHPEDYSSTPPYHRLRDVVGPPPWVMPPGGEE